MNDNRDEYPEYKGTGWLSILITLGLIFLIVSAIA